MMTKPSPEEWATMSPEARGLWTVGALVEFNVDVSEPYRIDLGDLD